ncbi:MAG: methyltransferase, partial [Clostridia bacterium]|nr:methyltransferase [Clostridia bacterium]
MVELEKLEQFARKNFIPVMLDDTKQLLFNTVKALQPKRILEVGTAIGYSGIVMLTASPSAHLNTIEMLETSAQMARKNFADAGVADRATIFVGD